LDAAIDCADPADGGQLDDRLGKTRQAGSLQRVPWQYKRYTQGQGVKSNRKIFYKICGCSSSSPEVFSLAAS
jgi:hypothetical protein